MKSKRNLSVNIDIVSSKVFSTFLWNDQASYSRSLKAIALDAEDLGSKFWTGINHIGHFAATLVSSAYPT